MFERFTEAARNAVIGPVEEARDMRAGRVGTEHLLLGVLRGTGSAARVLTDAGLTQSAVRAELQRLAAGGSDAGALHTIGIDLDAVRGAVEKSFGPGSLDRARRPRRLPSGRIPMSRRVKKALELALRQAVTLRDTDITAEHLLLGILAEGEGLAVEVISALGVAGDDLRDRLLRARGQAA